MRALRIAKSQRRPKPLIGSRIASHHVGELLARPLHARERDEAAQDLVGALEDQVDAASRSMRSYGYSCM